jgi:NAD+ kinase
LMTQVADGIIMSTPTGTTAYCLSAGGPIVAPDLDCITVTPVAAHLSVAHAIVVPPHRRVCLSLATSSDAVASVDGQIDLPLQPGDRVVGSISQRKACFVRFGGDGHFYETVLRRLRWPDRVRTS